MIDGELYHIWTTDDPAAAYSNRFAYCMKLSQSVNVKDPQTGTTQRYDLVAYKCGVGTVVKLLAISRSMSDDEIDFGVGQKVDALAKQTKSEQRIESLNAQLTDMGPTTHLHASLEMIVLKALIDAEPGTNLDSLWNRTIRPKMHSVFETHKLATKDINRILLQLGTWKTIGSYKRALNGSGPEAEAALTRWNSYTVEKCKEEVEKQESLISSKLSTPTIECTAEEYSEKLDITKVDKFSKEFARAYSGSSAGPSSSRADVPLHAADSPGRSPSKGAKRVKFEDSPGPSNERPLKERRNSSIGFSFTITPPRSK